MIQITGLWLILSLVFKIQINNLIFYISSSWFKYT